MKYFLNSIGLAVAFLLLTSGCSLHQVASPDPGPLPEKFSETNGNPPQRLPAPWWESFNDPTLTELIETTLADNLDIAQAVARFEQADTILRTTKAGRQPFLGLEAQQSRDSRTWFNGTQITSSSYRFSLSAGYELDLWQKIKFLSDAARAETLASKEAIKSLCISISAQVADLYFLAHSLRVQLDLIDKTITSLIDTEQLILSRYQDGLLPAPDLYQARQNLAAGKIRKTELKSNLAKTEHSLAVVLGHFSTKKYHGELLCPPEIPEAFPAGIPSDLLKNRPDIQAARLKVIAKDETIGAAIANRFPSINLLASYGRTDYPVTAAFWNLFAGLTQPIIDGGNRRAEVDRSKAALKEALAFYRQTVLQAVREVEDSLTANRETEEKLRLTKKQRELANAALQLHEANYQYGINDYLSVLAAQRNLLEIDSQLIENNRLLISHRISLARALGGSWTEDYLQTNQE